jgi:hypothetical protein
LRVYDPLDLLCWELDDLKLLVSEQRRITRAIIGLPREKDDSKWENVFRIASSPPGS